MYLPKGKWIPGMKPKDRPASQYYCEDCGRGFVSHIGLQKHLASELHFKRKARNEGKELQTNNDLFDEAVFSRSTLYREKRKKPDTSFVRLGNHGQQTLHCPTCYSKVDKLLMGKHLISHFHCQKVSRKERRVDPEKKLILEHIHQISLQSPFQCGPCKYYFTHREQLLQHFEQQHIKLEAISWSKRNMLNRWRCSSCPAILAKDENDMLSHLTSTGHCKMEAAISKSIPIILRKVSLRSCEFCSKTFILNREVASHINKVHRVADTDDCISINPSVNIQSLKLNEIDRTTHQPKYDKDCPVALNSTESSISLNKHKLECSKCSKLFRKISSLNRHKAHAHPSVYKDVYKCSMCNYTTRKSSDFHRHSKRHNKDREKSFQCDICSSAFFEMYALEHHKKIHYKKTVLCKHPGCQFLGRNKSEVETHYLRHLDEKMFICSECSFSSKSKFSLTRHTKLSHNKESKREFSCKFCSYSSNLYNCLKRHELQHKTEKSFYCPHCNFSSKTLENLRIHVVRRKIHSGRFLYNCTICQSVTVDKNVFRTNTFSEFKYHVAQSHSDSVVGKSDLELLVVSGIKKQESDAVALSINNQQDLPLLEYTSAGESVQNLNTNSENELCQEKNIFLKHIDPKSLFADSSFMENAAAGNKSENEFSSENESPDHLPAHDIFVDEIYDNLLIVSDEEIQFANVTVGE